VWVRILEVKVGVEVEVEVLLARKRRRELKDVFPKGFGGQTLCHFKPQSRAKLPLPPTLSYHPPTRLSKTQWRQVRDTGKSYFPRYLFTSHLPLNNTTRSSQLTTMNAGREQDKEATVYIGNLDERVTDALVWELMLQAGRIVNVHLPKDRVTQTHQGYGFVEFISEEDADYAAKIMNQVRLYGKPIRVNKASADKQKTVEVGAELFIGNLDSFVDEKTLFDTFSRFGSLVSAPKVRLFRAIHVRAIN
jgi:hypothetical protein